MTALSGPEPKSLQLWFTVSHRRSLLSSQKVASSHKIVIRGGRYPHVSELALQIVKITQLSVLFQIRRFVMDHLIDTVHELEVSFEVDQRPSVHLNGDWIPLQHKV